MGERARVRRGGGGVDGVGVDSVAGASTGADADSGLGASDIVVGGIHWVYSGSERMMRDTQITFRWMGFRERTWDRR